jgi:hypothetical protein
MTRAYWKTSEGFDSKMQHGEYGFAAGKLYEET